MAAPGIWRRYRWCVKLVVYAMGFAAAAALDSVTPLAMADWLIPVCLVCFVSARAGRMETTAVAVAATACMVAGLWSSPSGGMPFWMGALNRLAAVCIIWICVYAAHRRSMREVEAKVLRGLLAICSSCKRIRYDDDQWQNLESYITRHSEARFTHTLCPLCFEHYSEKKTGTR
jgi:hypothetical protein